MPAASRELPKPRPESLQEPENNDNQPPLWRSALAEAVGTFALTAVAAGAIVIDEKTGGGVGHVGKTVAPGLTVAAIVYSLGHASGAHINPGVTLAFALRRSFPVLHVPVYWIAQLIGAVLGALAIRGIVGSGEHLGATIPHFGIGPGFWMELLLSSLLFTVILSVASNYSLVGPDAALAAGGTVAMCGLFADPVSGASMNPARSLGPAPVTGDLGQTWIYIAAPFAASMLAALLSLAIFDKKDPKEKDAAQGKR